MPDLPNRDKHERELAVAISMLWAKVAQQPTPDGIMRTNWAMPSILIKPLSAVYIGAATQLANQANFSVEPGRIFIAADRWSTVYSSKLAADIFATTTSIALAATSLANTGRAPFVDAVRPAFSPARAETIAITEVTRAATAGESGLAAWVAVNRVTASPVWHAVPDGLACSVCRSLHGEGPDVYNMIALGGPPAHPRCRCRLDWSFGRP